MPESVGRDLSPDTVWLDGKLSVGVAVAPWLVEVGDRVCETAAVSLPVVSPDAEACSDRVLLVASPLLVLSELADDCAPVGMPDELEAVEVTSLEVGEG